MVLFHNGQYDRTEDKAGLHFVDSFWYDHQTLSTARVSHQLTAAKMVDKMGTPLLVSGVVIYEVVNAYLATTKVENYRTFITDNSSSTLKAIVSKYPYECDEEDEKDEHSKAQSSLKTEGTQIAKELVQHLQEKLNPAGIYVHSFVFDELSYAPEIAASMLKRQQAHALVQARSMLVKGAVDTAQDAIQRLNTGGQELSLESREKLVVNLLTVMVAESDASPVVQV